MCQELMKAGRLFPPSEAMCQIQACSAGILSKPGKGNLD